MIVRFRRACDQFDIGGMTSFILAGEDVSVENYLNAAFAKFNRGSGEEVEFKGHSAGVGDVFELHGSLPKTGIVAGSYRIDPVGFTKVAWSGTKFVPVTPFLRLWLTAFAVARDWNEVSPQAWRRLGDALAAYREEAKQQNTLKRNLWYRANACWTCFDMLGVPCEPEQIAALQSILKLCKEDAYAGV